MRARLIVLELEPGDGQRGGPSGGGLSASLSSSLSSSALFSRSGISRHSRLNASIIRLSATERKRQSLVETDAARTKRAEVRHAVPDVHIERVWHGGLTAVSLKAQPSDGDGGTYTIPGGARLAALYLPAGKLLGAGAFGVAVTAEHAVLKAWSIACAVPSIQYKGAVTAVLEAWRVEF